MVAGKTLIQNTIVLVLRKRENNRAKIMTVGRKAVCKIRQHFLNGKEKKEKNK